MSISFYSIPIDIRVPGQYIEIDPTNAYKGLSGIPTKVLVIGQKLAAGTATPLVPYLITPADEAKKLFGAGSQLARMVEKFKGVNTLIEMHAIAQDDAVAGVAATGTIQVGGSPTESGTANIYIGGQLVQASILATDTSAQIAAKIQTAVAAKTDLPVTATVVGSTVTLTAKNKGVNGNYIDVRVNYYADQLTPSGVTFTITAMNGGATNPDLSAVLTAIGDTWYTDFALAYTDTANIVLMETELSDRFGPLKMIDGQCYISYSDTYANLVTKGDSRNSPHICALPFYKSPTPPWEWTAIVCGVASYFAKQDPARPLQTLPLTGGMAPSAIHQFIMEERDVLLRHGMGTYTVDAGGVVRIERLVTNYRVNSSGAADQSYLDIETLKTLTYLRYDLRTYIALRYPRHKLADDGTNFARGQAVVTPSVIRAAIINRFKQWENEGLAENVDQFKADLIVERDSNDRGRANALVPLDIVNQFRTFAAGIQYNL